MIADECRINSHSFKDHEDEYSNLIRHHELAQVKYSSGSGESLMPIGLETHDVYFIQWIKRCLNVMKKWWFILNILYNIL